jgi:O-antigen/teichoic acid export membrane protein
MGDKAKVLSSLFWKFMERGGTQGVQFAVQIVLARLLIPRDYGLIALVMVFITLCNVLIQSGFNTALIQKKDADELDFSSVFFLTVFISLFLYLLLFLSAPLIGGFYGHERLVGIIRVQSVVIVLGALYAVQNAFIARNMLFKKLFMSSLSAIVVSGVIGVVAATRGFGVWAIVMMQISNQLIVVSVLWFTVDWRPKFIFSLKRIGSLFSYSWKLVVSAFLETFYEDLVVLIIGRLYPPAMLGFYNRGYQFPELLVSNIDGTIQSVLLPTLSSKQDEPALVKSMVKRAIKTSTFVMFPMMVGLAVIAKPLVIVLLTPKWLPSVPFIQVFCGVYALMPLHTTNLQAIKALGRSDVFLKLEVIKKVVGISILVAMIPFGILAIAMGYLISGAIGTFINSYPNKQLLGYNYMEQIKDILPSLVIASIMGALIYSIGFLPIQGLLLLIVQTFTGVVVYFLLAWAFKLESFSYIILTIKEKISDRKYKIEIENT